MWNRDNAPHPLPLSRERERGDWTKGEMYMQNRSKQAALVLDPLDNVAVLLKDTPKDKRIALTDNNAEILASEPIKTGHKMAVSPISSGSDIIKYGQKIGVATSDIHPGEWVHLHNMESAYDTDFRKRVAL